MGYFANSSEGMLYEAAYCEHCIHYGGCPVLSLHVMWNYEAVEDEVKREALDMFIPRDEHGESKQCLMFVEERDAREV